MTKNFITLKGLDLLQLGIGYNSTGDEPEKDRRTKEIRVMIHDGVAFTVPENVFQEWKAGKTYSFKLVKGEREVEDPQDPTRTVSIPALNFESAVSLEQYKALRAFEVQDALLEKTLMAEISSKVADLKLEGLPA